jgi:hypothetical protein
MISQRFAAAAFSSNDFLDDEQVFRAAMFQTGFKEFGGPRGKLAM